MWKLWVHLAFFAIAMMSPLMHVSRQRMNVWCSTSWMSKIVKVSYSHLTIIKWVKENTDSPSFLIMPLFPGIPFKPTLSTLMFPTFFRIFPPVDPHFPAWVSWTLVGVKVVLVYVLVWVWHRWELDNRSQIMLVDGSEIRLLTSWGW